MSKNFIKCVFCLVHSVASEDGLWSVWWGGVAVVAGSDIFVWYDTRKEMNNGQWYPGQPSGNENCVNWFVKLNQINDKPCVNRLRFVCEFP